MDRRDVEPSAWLHEGQPRLQALLCGSLCGAVSRSAGSSLRAGFDLRLVPEKLGEPLKWQTPKMIFVNSMSDLFQEGIAEEYIEAVAKVMVKPTGIPTRC